MGTQLKNGHKIICVIICAHEMAICCNCLSRTARGQCKVISFLSYAPTHWTEQFRQVFNSSFPIKGRSASHWETAFVGLKSLTKAASVDHPEKQEVKSPLTIFTLLTCLSLFQLLNWVKSRMAARSRKEGHGWVVVTEAR